MKEIKVSFEIRIASRRTDVHWVKQELLSVRQEVCLKVFMRVMEEIKRQELKRAVVEELKGLV